LRQSACSYLVAHFTNANTDELAHALFLHATLTFALTLRKVDRVQGLLAVLLAAGLGLFVCALAWGALHAWKTCGDRLIGQSSLAYFAYFE
jgi:hypothetical protein